MSRKTTAADQTLREVFESPEYLAALRERLVAGTAKKSEVDLARSLGIVVDDETAEREAMRQMEPRARGVLLDMNRMAGTSASTELRVIQGGDYIGVGYSVTTRQQNDAKLRQDLGLKPTTEPDASTEDEPDLLPARKAKA